MVLQQQLKNLLFLIPLAIIVACVVVSNSEMFLEYPAELSTAMTFDLLFTVPLIYYFIILKRKIPKTTVIPVLIVGVVVASIILPAEHQYYLTQFKTWILPVVEISIITYLIITIRKAVKVFKRENSGVADFFTAAKQAGNSFLPPRVSILFATELSMFYYGFINWKKRKAAENEFTYHRSTSTRITLGVFLFVILVEAVAVHLLLLQWSNVAAWIMTALSGYAVFQVLGILKSLSQRPIAIESDGLVLRCGIMVEASIEWTNILEVKEFKKEITKEDGITYFSPFQAMEGHNVLIKLKHTESISGFYGMKKEFQDVAVYVDEYEQFLNEIINRINPSLQSTP